MSDSRPAPVERGADRPGPRLRLVALGIIATALIATIVLASRSSSVAPGAGEANAGPVIAIVHAVEIFAIAAEVLAVLLLIAFFLTARRRRAEEGEGEPYEEPNRVPWWLRVVVFLLPIVVFGGLTYVLLTMQPANEAPQLAPIEFAPSSPQDGGFASQVGANLGLAWWEILVAIVLAGVVFIAIVRAFRTPRTAIPVAPPEVSQSPSALAVAVTTGLRDARHEPDPRRAVIVAYASMEQVLAAHGLPRRAVEAPLEYMARLFGEIDSGGEAVLTLTDLFEVARFSQHPISPAMRERAIAALVTIERELQVAR